MPYINKLLNKQLQVHLTVSEALQLFIVLVNLENSLLFPSNSLIMETVKYWYLKNHNLFSQMKESDIQSLCVITGFKKALKNEVIYFTHEPVRRLYLLKKGILKIAMMDEEGNEQTKEIIHQGDIFGEITLNKHAHQELNTPKCSPTKW
jgi:CRP-like cAMP-binding protein